jgi:hypothetical protein
MEQDMTQSNALEMIRLRAAATAQGQDAQLWRWFSDRMEDRCLDCRRHEEYWSIKISGRELARDRSFDVAIRSAYTLSRALEVM